MAATVQSQQSNPQLKRLVYSKYRELLGSYNDKANSIIQSLPSYMVTEDRGFHFENNNDSDEIDNANYGTPPAPPSFAGSIPSRRLPSNVPATSDPPACVQNAMMTKDKKPFTYTPGGIDLSQIKSPRMAKRIARNAQYEGVTGPPKPSPLAQSNATQYSPPAVPYYGAQAVGTPVQVIPNGPPPPPPVPHSGAAPAPPPPPQGNRNHLTPHTNGMDARKSPSPQNFEPPPLGCRPEIKIPPNPMANLKKVPKPREKNEFWIEEYIKERSASPMVNTSADSTAQNNNYYQQSEQNNRELSPVGNNLEPAVMKQQEEPLIYARPQQVRSPSPIRQHNLNQQTSVQQNSPGMNHQIQFQQNRVDSPFQSHDNPSLQRPLSPIRANHQPQFNQQEQRPAPVHIRSQSQPQTASSPPIQQQQQKNSQVGSIYIPPISQENLNTNRQQQQRQQSPPLQQHLQQQQQQRTAQASNSPTPRWMAQKAPMREVPEWVRDDKSPPSSPFRHVQTPESPINHQTASVATPQSPVHHVQAPQSFSNSPSNSNSTGLRIQINPKTASNAKERIIPIQMEQTPTPSRTPSTPGFGPQPFYNGNQQFSSVTSPNTGYSSPTSGYNLPSQTSTTRNPNQFVDQGYNSIPSRWQAQQRVTSPSVQQSPPPPSSSASSVNSGTRIIPIAIEGQDQPFNPNSVRGPISSSPLVIQNDPRTLQHQNSWGGSGGQPNQSKSFRILQKLTDTADEKDTNSEQSSSVQLQRPQYSRQMGAIGGNDSPTDQMRRMQLNDHDQAFMNRVKNQVPMQRPQQPRYVQQRSNYQQNDQPQAYIHPSEQQVPEPKKYTGSAIPSRSFKILQAMTTPENAGPGQSDL